jgi:hypothetical protein
MKQELYRMPWAKITGDFPDWRLHKPIEDPVPERIRKKFNRPHRKENKLIFAEPDPVTQAKFLEIPKMLGLADAYTTVNVQRPGAVTVLHTDKEQANFPDENAQFKRILKKAFKLGTDAPFGHMSNEDQYAKLERCFVFLEDHKPGHVIILDGEYVTDWRRGDVLWFDWRDCVHATCNISHETRALLQIMGHRTDKWKDIHGSSRLTEFEI